MQRKILSGTAEEDLRSLIFDFRLKIDGNKFIEELEAEVSKKRVPFYYKGSSRKSDYCYDIGYQKLLPRIIQQIEQYDKGVTKAA